MEALRAELLSLMKQEVDIETLSFKLAPGAEEGAVRKGIQEVMGPGIQLKNRKELNQTLYRMLNTENLATYPDAGRPARLERVDPIDHGSGRVKTQFSVVHQRVLLSRLTSRGRCSTGLFIDSGKLKPGLLTPAAPCINRSRGR